MNKRVVTAIVAVLAIALLGGAALGVVLVMEDDGAAPADGPTARPSSTLTGDPTSLDRFYGQKIQWAPCGGNECGTIEVPIDYQKPAEGTLFLNLQRTRATGERVGSLVVNPGGPGAPGTDMIEQADLYFAAPLRKAFDIVGFDPRGTGKSDPVDCITDTELDDQTAADPDPDTPAEVAATVTLGEDFWAGCRARSGRIASHVSTVEAARDMDVLRSALGEQQLNYLGFSYGTKLGATYAELYPANTGRLVLDGAVDPTLSSRASSLSQARGFEVALRSYVQNCVGTGSCFLGSTVDAGVATIKKLIDSIDAKPLPTNDPGDRELTVGRAFYGLVLPLYSEDSWSFLDQGLQQALDGDGSTLLQLSDYYGSRENGRYTDNSLEAIAVINCLDDPTSIEPSQVAAQYPDFDRASPTFGRVFAWGLIGCRGIPFASTDQPNLVIDGAGAAPIMVLGTTRDPATPYEEAVALSKQLKSGFLVTRDGDGHPAYNTGNDCIDKAVHEFLIDDQQPTAGLRC
ncbi:alpha/beta hydrolase [Nocardioides sp.]|uniref:alpha/beta hydrolase n=1 Tax=Nocardioides sp. TaxID=35761 RepID=UPI0035118ED5